MTRQLLTDDMRRRLVAAREAKGWSVAELANSLQWSRHFLARLETGAFVPRNKYTIEEWHKALGLELKVEIE